MCFSAGEFIGDSLPCSRSFHYAKAEEGIDAPSSSAMAKTDGELILQWAKQISS
jgi:hypothetical protein